MLQRGVWSRGCVAFDAFGGFDGFGGSAWWFLASRNDSKHWP